MMADVVGDGGLPEPHRNSARAPTTIACHHDRMTRSDDASVFKIRLGLPDDAFFELRFPKTYRDEVRDLLDENALEHNTGMEFSYGPSEWIEHVDVLSASAGASITALATALHRFFTRNSGKKISLDAEGNVTQVDGYSVKEFERILIVMAARKPEHDRRMREASGIEDEANPTKDADPEA